MARAVNDATLQKAGDMYQYLIALRDCFDLVDGDTLQIETNGDVSIINDKGDRFQKEVKHHFGKSFISDRDIDFWKTLANWYVDYERIKNFSNYILRIPLIIAPKPAVSSSATQISRKSAIQAHCLHAK